MQNLAGEVCRDRAIPAALVQITVLPFRFTQRIFHALSFRDVKDDALNAGDCAVDVRQGKILVCEPADLPRFRDEPVFLRPLPPALLEVPGDLCFESRDIVGVSYTRPGYTPRHEIVGGISERLLHVVRDKLHRPDAGCDPPEEHEHRTSIDDVLQLLKALLRALAVGDVRYRAQNGSASLILNESRRQNRLDSPACLCDQRTLGGRNLLSSHVSGEITSNPLSAFGRYQGQKVEIGRVKLLSRVPHDLLAPCVGVHDTTHLVNEDHVR